MSEPLREMLISHDTNETRVALLEDRELVELYIERPKRSVVGNVYLGKVKDVLPGMQAAFIDIGLEKNAFLYVDEVVAPEGLEDFPKPDIQSMLKGGQQVMVQVLKDPMGTKGARVTTQVTLPGRFLVLMPFSEFVGVSRKVDDVERERLHAIVAPHVPQGTGVIVRTVAAGVPERDLVSDLEFLLRLWKRVNHQATEGLAPEVIYTEMDLALRLVRDVFSDSFKRLVVDDRGVGDKVTSFLKRTSPHLVRRVQTHKDRSSLFDTYQLQSAIESALSRTVTLPSGGYVSIDPTEALTAIDVNTGKFVGRKSLEETVYRTNIEAADEIARQLRLRDIGGIIVIDFIDMDDSYHRQEVMRRFSAALERDRTRTRVTELSRLGLVEMTRKNVTDGLYTALTERCSTCGGDGRVLSGLTRRITVERRIRELLSQGRSDAYLLGVHPETYEQLMAPGLNVVASLRASTGRQLAITAEESCAPTEVKVLIEGRVGG